MPIDLKDKNYRYKEKDFHKKEFKKQFYDILLKDHGYLYAELCGPYAEEKYGIGWKNGFLLSRGELRDFSLKFEDDIKLSGEFYPLKENLLKSFELTKLEDVKCVIWGQDPYPSLIKIGDEEVPRAQGYSFGVHRDDEIPISLKNIFKCIKRDYPMFVIPDNGDLTYLAKQGVLFMNACLAYFPNIKMKKETEKKTFKKVGKRLSSKKEDTDESEDEDDETKKEIKNDKNKDSKAEKTKLQVKYIESWLPFTKIVCDIINNNVHNCVHMLWGAKAQQLQKNKAIKGKNILTSSHPSGFSAYSANNPFVENNHFLLCNIALRKLGKQQINWNNEEITDEVCSLEALNEIGHKIKLKYEN